MNTLGQQGMILGLGLHDQINSRSNPSDVVGAVGQAAAPGRTAGVSAAGGRATGRAVVAGAAIATL